MNDLPSGWAWTTLGEIGDWYGGGTPSKRRQDFWDSGTIPWISPKDMREDVLASTIDHITPEAVSCSPASIVPQGSVAIVVRSGILERRVPVASVPFETTLNQDMKAVVPASGIMHQWIRYAIQFNGPRILRDCRKDGTTVASLDTSRLMTLPIPMAPPEEQSRIVSILEEHEAALERSSQILNKAARRCDKLTLQLVDDAILGRSVGHELVAPAKPLTGRYARFSYRDLPALPPGWEWRLASDVCQSINSGSTPSADLMSAGQGEIPLLKVYNLHKDGFVDFLKNPTYIEGATHRGKLGRSIVRPGDVLTNIVGPPLGKSAVVPDTFPEWNINQAIVSFRAGDQLLPGWLATCLRSRFLVDLLGSTARATAGQFNIALSTCRDMPIPVPPISRQREVLSELDCALHAIKRCTSMVNATTRRVETQRRSALESALNGALTTQSSEDESADTILTRIRVKREVSGTAAQKTRKTRTRKATST